MLELLRFLITIIIAYLVGKIVAKMKLPSILGWLITGMVLGPHALSLMNQEVLDSKCYEILIPILITITYTTFANMISEKQLEYIMNGFNPILGIAILIVILNLGTPLDYHLILGAGLI